LVLGLLLAARSQSRDPGELAGDEPGDVRTRGEGKVDGSVPAHYVEELPVRAYP
jgi:hypothetical protein